MCGSPCLRGVQACSSCRYSQVVEAQQALVAVQEVIRATDGVKLPCTPSSQVEILTRWLEAQKVNFENVKPVRNLPKELCFPREVQHILSVFITHPQSSAMSSGTLGPSATMSLGQLNSTWHCTPLGVEV